MNLLQFGDYTLDRGLRQLRRGEERVPLPVKAFDLLAYMATNAGRPLPKSELLQAVWPDSFVEEANLAQNVFLLRKALVPVQPIVTLPGLGYQFAVQVMEIVAPQPVELPVGRMEIAATHSRLVYEEDVEERIAFRRSPAAVGLAALGLIGVGLSSWLGWQRYEDRVGGPPVQVVLADAEGTTGDPVLDRTLSSVLRIELAQSPFVSVVSSAIVRQTMAQMKHKPDDTLTVPLARDLCERTASQAVLRSTVARAGSGFVLTEEATNCVDGSTLGQAKQVAARAEDLPGAIEKLSATIRHELGESRRTIARFDKPLAPVETESIEALKDFSQSSFLAQSGRFTEGMALMKQAVRIDPHFAAAYLNLGIYAVNSLDAASARTYLRKAYELRDGATEPTRLFISAMYDTEILEDLYASLRDYQAWIALYPGNAQAWSGATQVYRELGDSTNELKSARRMMELLPSNVVVYQAVARAQTRTGDIAGARATCEQALRLGFDAQNIRYLLLRIGHLQHDTALVAEQESWAKAHPDAGVLLANETEFAIQEGRLNDADTLIERVDSAFRQSGSPQSASSLHKDFAAHLLDVGEDQRGRKLLEGVTPDPESYPDLLAMAKIGKGADVEKSVEQQLAAHAQSTVWNLRYAPLLRGEIALQAGDPARAIAALEPARRLEWQDLDVNFLRGKAFLAVNRLPEAEAEFRAILAHPEIDPGCSQLDITHLSLARVLAREGKRMEAIDTYRQFMALWANSNGDPVLLREARAELAQLQAAV